MPKATTSTSAPRAEPTHPDRRSDPQKPRHAPRYRVHPGLRRRNLPRQLPGLAQTRLDTQQPKKARSPPRYWRNDSAETPTQQTGGTSAAWPALPTQNLSTASPNGLFPYSQLKFALSKGVIYEKTHEVLSEVEDRLLDQYVEVAEVYRDTHRLSEISHGRNFNFSTTPTSPTYLPLKANGTKQTLPMPPTHSSEASPKLKSAIPFGPIPLHPPS